MLNELRHLLKATKKRGHLILLLILRSPFEAMRTALHAWFLSSCISAISQKDIHNLYKTYTIFLLISLFLFLYNGTIWVAYSGCVTKIESMIRKKMFYHVSGLSLEEIETKSQGEWFTRLNSDVKMDIINKPLHLPHALIAIVNIMLSAILLYIISPNILTLVILFLIPHLVISQLFISKPMTTLTTKVKEATDRNTTYMNALITCADTATLYDGWDFLLHQFEESSRNIKKANMKKIFRNAFSDSLLPMLGMSGYLIILLIASRLIWSGKLTFASLLAAFQYRGGVLVGALMLTNSIVSMKSSLASIKRLNETMIKTEESYERTPNENR